MRYGKNSEFSAEEIINSLPQEEIGKILKECGGEKFAERIARGIVEARKIKRIKTTLQLVEIIKKTIPSFYRCQKIHFATRTFQAIRIAVNRELDNLKKALPQAVEILSPGGRLAVISFHSLEDKIVKNFIREKARENILKIITKKPVVPGQEEKIINPRSRSGKLRAVIKI